MKANPKQSQLVNQAKGWLKYHSEAYAESKMWQSRDMNTSIKHIVKAIETAKKQLSN